MKISEFKTHLQGLHHLDFKLPDGTAVPPHFHLTEIGLVNKQFIDCGGKVRNERLVSFQLWEAGDTHHRLTPEKLSHILSLAEKTLEMEDLEIEVEYQYGTIGRFGLSFTKPVFQLTNKQTACLAEDRCGSSPREDAAVPAGSSVCVPKGGCC